MAPSGTCDPFDFSRYGELLRYLLHKVALYLGYEIKNATEEALKIFNKFVDETYGGWTNIVRKGIEWGVNTALKALEAVKEVIVEKCKKDKRLLKHLSEIAMKAVTRRCIEVGVKGVARIVVPQGAINPVGIGADLAQAGCEFFGYEEAGKMVGKSGNIVSGMLIGGTVGGLPGAAVGALGGFLIWLGGEVTGGLVERAFAEEGQTGQEGQKGHTN